MYEENTWNIIASDWGATLERVLELSVKLLWLHIIENLMITSILGALIIYQESPEVIDSRVGSVS